MDLKRDTFYYGDSMANKSSTSKKTTYLEYATREFFRRVKVNQSRMEHSPLPRWKNPPVINSKQKLEQLLPYMQQLTYTKDYEKYEKKKETLPKESEQAIPESMGRMSIQLNREDPSSSIHLTWNDRTFGKWNAQCNRLMGIIESICLWNPQQGSINVPEMAASSLFDFLFKSTEPK